MSQANQNEEVDLGQLFRLIGNAFENFFKLLRNVLKNIFHFIVIFLQFIQKHFWKLAISGIIGIIGGGYWDYIAQPVYSSSMVVEPNFNSVQQLYNNIEFYNELAAEEEFQSLADALNISLEEAQSMKRFEIESFSDQTQKIKQFSEFISSLDTISQKKVDYEDYLNNFNNINAKFHKIIIESTNSTAAKKCQPTIVSSIENNEYFKLQKKVNELNLAIQDSIIIEQLVEIDTLQKFYKKIKTLEASKPEGSTNINLSESNSQESPELGLLDEIDRLKTEIVELNTERANTQNTINVISAFPNKGALVNEYFKRKIVLLPAFLVIVVFGLLLLVALNNFLKSYKTN